MESGKIVLMILLAGQQRGQRHFGHSESVRRWDDLGEQHWNVTLPYVKWIASVDSMYDPGNPKPVLCDNPEGLDEEGSGEQGSRGRGHMYT